MPVPVKPGLVFVGWYLGNVNYTPSTIYSIESDVELIAHWAYTVTFDKNGGSGGSDFVYAEYNNPMPDAEKPELRGYKFNGYFTSLDNEGIRYYDEFMSGCRLWDKEQNATLIAKWTEMKIEVNLEKEGGEGGSNFVLATYGQDMPEAIAPHKIGYRFCGYFTEKDGKGDMYYNAEMQSVLKCYELEKFDLYAYWERLYTITFNKNGGEGGTDSVQVIRGEEMPLATAPTLAHNDFKGYYLDGDKNPYYNADMTSNRTMDKEQDITLYAKYTPVSYDINYNMNISDYDPDLGWSNSGNPFAITYFQTITLNEPTRVGYKFNGWYLDGKKVTSLSKIDRSITLVASWIGTVISASSEGIDIIDNYTLVNIYQKFSDQNFFITVKPSVTQLCVYSIRGQTINLSIMIEDRTNDFNLVICNMDITAPSGKHAILMKSNTTLHLYSYYSSITGADKLTLDNASLRPEQGSSAIYCKHLTIHTSAYIKGGSNMQGSTDDYVGGIAISLVNGGSVKILSDNVSIIGGDSFGLGNRTCGLPIFSSNHSGLVDYINFNQYTNNYSQYSNVIIKVGYGNLPTTPPYVGY